MNINVAAPAKINLMLDITGKRDDGYHTLATVMQSVSLSDIVTISENNNGIISVKTNNSSIPSDENNIAHKAAVEFIKAANIQHNGLDIHIQKNIPSEAGLGGGSADAAAVLIGLNCLYGTNLSTEQLCDIGVKIGADVPFCIVGGTKYCTGIGEIITEASALEECYIVIAKGNTGISTKNAFGKIDALGFDIDSDFNKYNGSVLAMKEYAYNRFELVTDNEDVKFIKGKMLIMGAEYSAMSGSGSAVFGLFFNEIDAQKCADYLCKTNLFATLCKPISNGAKIM